MFLSIFGLYHHQDLLIQIRMITERNRPPPPPPLMKLRVNSLKRQTVFMDFLMNAFVHYSLSQSVSQSVNQSITLSLTFFLCLPIFFKLTLIELSLCVKKYFYVKYVHFWCFFTRSGRCELFDIMALPRKGCRKRTFFVVSLSYLSKRCYHRYKQNFKMLII